MKGLLHDWGRGGLGLKQIADRLTAGSIGKYPYTYDLPDPDLIIRPAALRAVTLIGWGEEQGFGTICEGRGSPAVHWAAWTAPHSTLKGNGCERGL